MVKLERDQKGKIMPFEDCKGLKMGDKTIQFRLPKEEQEWLFKKFPNSRDRTAFCRSVLRDAIHFEKVKEQIR